MNSLIGSHRLKLLTSKLKRMTVSAGVRTTETTFRIVKVCGFDSNVVTFQKYYAMQRYMAGPCIDAEAFLDLVRCTRW